MAIEPYQGSPMGTGALHAWLQRDPLQVTYLMRHQPQRGRGLIHAVVAAAGNGIAPEERKQCCHFRAQKPPSEDEMEEKGSAGMAEWSVELRRQPYSSMPGKHG